MSENVTLRHRRYCPPTTSKLGDELLNPAPERGSVAHKACMKLSRECRALNVSSKVDVVDEVPSPLCLARDYVGANKPLLMRGAVAHWPAVSKWTPQYLRDRVGDVAVSVAVTPNGYADAPSAGHLVLPQERVVPFAAFLDVMERPQTQHGVWYVQKQNSNLTEEFSGLLGDLEASSGGREASWFSETLGRRPDAVNFWMGDARAVTSMHKDPYENLYCVVSGYKDFLLLPPCDAPWVPYRRYPVATYCFSDPARGDSDGSSTTTPTRDDCSDGSSRTASTSEDGGDGSSISLPSLNSLQRSTVENQQEKIHKQANGFGGKHFLCLRCMGDYGNGTNTSEELASSGTKEETNLNFHSRDITKSKLLATFNDSKSSKEQSPDADSPPFSLGVEGCPHFHIVPSDPACTVP
ncbi:bifunctional peptidase and (3S)-lysyl hydroxylase Jmjd7 [Hyalella azteca]|uniref:Bifunctional peptidase and (3S)-lysyl hydroxylase Jmjd7 n=1 Tax=Hyalella azteca TaxID=294128 RepID=A0A8B7NP87_HYAAZ|nr:bifunctional peptidase and (3S)-lysyl hydroxylase Jmjd7 [Hyalella azteca]